MAQEPRPDAANPGSNLQSQKFLEHAQADPQGTLIVLDVDGTISEIASRPEEARVGEAIRETLRRIARRYRLWIVSGRDATVARSMVAIDRAGYIGAHGLEALDGDGLRLLADARGVIEQIDRLAAGVVAELPELAEFVERKRWSVAFHYRALPAVKNRLRSAIEERLEPGLLFQSGKKVYEVLPDLGVDKGTALDWLIDTHHPRLALVAGDDCSDLPMFRSLNAHRAAGQIEGLAIAVLQEEETPSDLVGAAGISVPGISGLDTFLGGLL